MTTRKSNRALQWIGLALTLVLTAAACADAPQGREPTVPTSGSPPAAPSTVPSPDDCEASESSSPLITDLDGDGLNEVAFIEPKANGATLVLCIADDRLQLEMNSEVTVAGFQDLDEDGVAEILFERETSRGLELGAVALTLRGLALTSVTLSHWIADTASGAGVFDGESYQCLDWDFDGDTELVRWQYRPADAEVNVRASIIEIEGLQAVEGGVDSFETSPAEALALWDERDGCGPGKTAIKGVRFSEFGWAKVSVEPELFVDRDDISLMSIATNGEVLAAVGYEGNNPIVGQLTEPMPLAWWSTDGIRWEEARVEGSNAYIMDVVVHDGVFVGVGEAERLPAVWTSEDGESWFLLTLDTTLDGGEATIYSVISANDSLTAVGTERYWAPNGHADLDAAVWTSENGHQWTRVQSDSFGTPGYQPNQDNEFNGVIYDISFGAEQGFVAVGFDTEAEAEIDFPEHYPAVWSSKDGLAWERTRLPDDVRLKGVISGNGLYAAYGTTERSGSPTSDAAILTSIDGITWTSAQGSFGTLEGEDGIQSIQAIREAPDGTWLALGSDEAEFESRGAIAVWESTDLLIWERQPNDEAAFGDVEGAPAPTVTDATTTEAGLLIGVGSIGETVELTGGGSACCLFRPHILAYDPTRG